MHANGTNKVKNPQRSATVRKFYAYERWERTGYENWVRTKYSGFTVFGAESQLLNNIRTRLGAEEFQYKVPRKVFVNLIAAERKSWNAQPEDADLHTWFDSQCTDLAKFQTASGWFIGWFPACRSMWCCWNICARQALGIIQKGNPWLIWNDGLGVFRNTTACVAQTGRRQCVCSKSSALRITIHAG